MNAGNIEFKTQKQASMCSNVQMCDWWGWIKCLFHSLIPSNCQKDPAQIQPSFATCAAMMTNMRRLQCFLFALHRLIPTWMCERGAQQSDETILSKPQIHLTCMSCQISCCLQSAWGNLCFAVFFLNWTGIDTSSPSEICSSGALRFILDHRSSCLHSLLPIRLHLISQIYKRKQNSKNILTVRDKPGDTWGWGWGWDAQWWCPEIILVS